MRISRQFPFPSSCSRFPTAHFSTRGLFGRLAFPDTLFESEIHVPFFSKLPNGPVAGKLAVGNRLYRIFDPRNPVSTNLVPGLHPAVLGESSSVPRKLCELNKSRKQGISILMMGIKIGLPYRITKHSVQDFLSKSDRDFSRFYV